MLKLFLYFVILFHATVIVLNLVTVFFIPFVEPWYVALPIDTLIINLTFSPTQCPLTKLENIIRRKLGWSEIRYFVAHYFVIPVRKRLRKFR